MKTLSLIAAASVVALATGVAAVTTAAASPTASGTPVEDRLAPVAAPVISQDADGYLGTWAVEGGSLVESYEKDGTVVSTGSSGLRGDLGADDVVSFGYVAGFGDPATGVAYAQLSGQAGPEVTGVRVVSASGVETEAALADGVWGAVWVAGDDADEYGAATIEVDTAAGTRTVSTDEVDVVAADQRAADEG